MAQSGTEVTIGGLHVTVTLGTYPVLQVAAAPQPYVLAGGLVLFLGALAWWLTGSRSGAAAAESVPA
jgi:hypothetical protein